MSMFHVHFACPFLCQCCMFMLYVLALSPCLLAACLRCWSMLLVHSSCSTCKSVLQVHVSMLQFMLHVLATCPCCMSILYVHVQVVWLCPHLCPCCIPMSTLHLHVHAASSFPLLNVHCSLSSRRGLVQEDKRMVLEYTHGLFIT